MIASSIIAVSTTAIELHGESTNNVGGQSWIFRLAEGSDTVYLGGETVTSATGFPWSLTDGMFSIEMDSDETLWAICATGESASVHRMGQGI